VIVLEVEKPLRGRAVWISAQLGHGNGALTIGPLGFIDHRITGLNALHIATVFDVSETAALEDELGHQAMKECIVVSAGLHIRQKVLDGLRGTFIVQIDLNITQLGLEFNNGRQG